MLCQNACTRSCPLHAGRATGVKAIGCWSPGWQTQGGQEMKLERERQEASQAGPLRRNAIWSIRQLTGWELCFARSFQPGCRASCFSPSVLLLNGLVYAPWPLLPSLLLQARGSGKVVGVRSNPSWSPGLGCFHFVLMENKHKTYVGHNNVGTAPDISCCWLGGPWEQPARVKCRDAFCKGEAQHAWPGLPFAQPQN